MTPVVESILTPEVRQRLAALPTARPCILLLIHESSRTGAPIIALELARRFRAQGCVVSVSFRSGALDPHFAEASHLHLAVPEGVDEPFHHGTRLIRTMATVRTFSFALVNSTVNWHALPTMTMLDLPTVFLVHEYLSTLGEAYHMPQWMWQHALSVFPTPGVLEDSIRIHPPLATARHAVRTPGLCHEPRDPGTERDRATENTRIRRLIRPPGMERAFVILGSGTVCPRKGIDLFLMTAASLRRQHPERVFRFVWVGGGYDPARDASYSLTLKNQIYHQQLEDIVVFTGEIDQLETAYDESDLFFLSSRADPLPLVAQAAMQSGLPVVCFDGTTGIAEHLRTDPRTASLVVPHLDIPGAAQKIAQLTAEPEYRRSLGARCREIAERDFCFDRYFKSLQPLIQDQITSTARTLRERDYLLQADVLDPDFLAYSNGAPLKAVKLVKTYLDNWRGGIHLRKPMPGFHPGIYRDRVETGGRDPLCHWLEAGRPAGPWCVPVIRAEIGGPAQPTHDSPAPGRTALHLHAFYPELVPEIIQRLCLNRARPDLWLTIPDHLDPATVLDACTAYTGRIEWRTVPNRGRDLGPLMTEIGPALAADYDIIGHIHTKQTAWHPDRNLIARWREFLLQNTLGGKHPMMDVILGRMASDPELGLVFPNTCMTGDWDNTRDDAIQLSRRMGLPPPEGEHLDFPVGSFFWARTRALRPLLEMGLDWSDYPAEPIPNSGTRLQTLERLPAFVALATGHRYAMTHTPGYTW